jgi:hypothetical protein
MAGIITSDYVTFPKDIGTMRVALEDDEAHLKRGPEGVF